MQRHPTHNHLNAPIHPTELGEDGDFGGVHNRKTRRARAAVERANARRAARRRARRDWHDMEADFRLDAIDDSTTFTGGATSTVVVGDR